MRRRPSLRVLLVAGVALTVFAGGGAAYVVVLRGSPDAAHNAGASRLPRPRPPALEQVSSSAPVPSPAGVAAALAAAARDPALGASLTGVVVDGTTGASLLARDPARALAPASTAKLLTAVAALEALGGSTRLSTGVVRAGDTLYLVGGGDVTLTARPTAGYPHAADLLALARQTARAVTGAGPLKACTDTSAWSGPARADGWTSSYFTGGDVAPLSPLEVDEAVLKRGARARAADPAAQALAAFVTDLRSLGVTATPRRCDGPAPASGLGVAAVDSPPVAALVQRMLTDSDNDLAEALGRAVARHDGDAADFAGEARAVTARIRGLGIATASLRLYDASGLSRQDRLSAATLSDLLRTVIAAGHPELRPVAEGLPVAGLTGTLGNRFRKPVDSNGAGVVRAKTGTLAGVNTLAGLVVDADGRLLVFAFMTDRASSPSATEAALDRLAARLAGCGCS